jgi:hypothetical protein
MSKVDFNIKLEFADNGAIIRSHNVLDGSLFTEVVEGEVDDIARVLGKTIIGEIEYWTKQDKCVHNLTISLENERND